MTASNLGVAAGKTVTLYAQWSDGVEAQMQDGVLEIKIKPGQKATIEGIPAGTTYQVFEDTVAGWQLVSQSGTSGTIASLETKEAVFTNQYDPGTATAQLFATKTLDGASATNGAFEFTITGQGNAPMPEGATNNTKTVTNGNVGLVDFGSIEYGMPGTYTYSIAEKPGNDSTVVYDVSEWTATVTVTNTGTDVDPVLSASVSYSNGVDEASATPPSFANTTMPGELTVTKTGVNVTPANRDAEFDFTVQLQNDGQPVDKASYYIENADGTPLTSQSESNGEQGGANPLSVLGRVATGARDALAGLFTPRKAYAEVIDSGTLLRVCGLTVLLVEVVNLPEKGHFLFIVGSTVTACAFEHQVLKVVSQTRRIERVVLTACTYGNHSLDFGLLCITTHINRQAVRQRVAACLRRIVRKRFIRIVHGKSRQGEERQYERKNLFHLDN